MALLKEDASPGFIDAVRQIEERADECFKTLVLLQHPSNIAIWSLLVGGIRRVEQQISQHGDNSQQLQSALINLSRSLPIAMKWSLALLGRARIRKKAQFSGVSEVPAKAGNFAKALENQRLR